jgi:hypothetical protein
MAFSYSPRIITNGLVLYLDAANTRSYPGSGTTWNDLSRSGNNGTLVNGPTYSSANLGSIVFDGTDDYVNCSSITWTPTSFTLMWVVNPKTRTDYNQRLLAFNDWGSFVFHTTTNGGIYVGTDVATRFTPSQLPSNTLVLDQNQIFTFTFNSGSAAFYKNGILLASRNGMTLPGPWGGFNIGRPDSNTINGTIGYVQIYNRALSATEILQNYNATKTRFGL